MNRVWIFVISEELAQDQLQELQSEGNRFVSGWTAHESKLTASFEIFMNRIIIVKVNESIHNASGCSIDKLTRFIKQMEQQFSVQLLNRQLVAYPENGKIKVTAAPAIPGLLVSGELNKNSTIYNTAVASENELKTWEQPLSATWLKKYIPAD